jgi:hypothetical protein
LYALDVQIERFKLDPTQYKQAEADFGEIWMGRTDLNADAPPPIPHK